MLYTIQEINANPNLLPGIILGAKIIDDCMSDTHALEQSMEFIRHSLKTLDSTQYECSDGNPALPKNKDVEKLIFGVVGASVSDVSIQVANLLRLFKMPQISYASTSSVLSDKTRFDYFARTVPSDSFQSKAMVDIVSYFNWTYVSTVASEGEYGESGIAHFTQEARARNICIATHQKIPSRAEWDRKIYEDIVSNLKTKMDMGEKRGSKAVILFVKSSDVPGFFRAFKNLNLTTDGWAFIASDGMGLELDPLKGLEYLASGAITLELQTEEIHQFDNYFSNLSPLKNDTIKRNPWFKEYWEDLYKCNFIENYDISPPQHSSKQNLLQQSNGARFSDLNSNKNKIEFLDQQENIPKVENSSLNTENKPFSPQSPGIQTRKQCTGLEQTSKHKQESKVQFVYQAVYAFAHALNKFQQDVCRTGRKLCPEMLQFDGARFFNKYIINNSFEGKFARFSFYFLLSSFSFCKIAT